MVSLWEFFLINPTGERSFPDEWIVAQVIIGVSTETMEESVKVEKKAANQFHSHWTPSPRLLCSKMRSPSMTRKVWVVACQYICALQLSLWQDKMPSASSRLEACRSKASELWLRGLEELMQCSSRPKLRRTITILWRCDCLICASTFVQSRPCFSSDSRRASFAAELLGLLKKLHKYLTWGTIGKP